MIKLVSRLIILIGLIPTVGIGQLNLNASYDIYAYNNLFRTPDPVRDYLSNYGIGASYGFKNSGLRLFNYFSSLNYQDNNDRNFITNSLGFSERIGLGENELSNLYFGGNWNLRINQPNFEYYNYSQLRGYINTQVYTEIMLFKGGYNYRRRDYPNWPELSNSLQNGYLQLNKSFPTRTTIIMEAGFSNKAITGTDTITTQVTMGQGNGRHSGGIVELTDEIKKALSTSQLSLTLRLTQSLGEKVGLYVQYYKQYSIDDETSYTNFDDYYQDDELFDDPFTYESSEYSSRLTLMLPKMLKIVLNGTYADKNYISEIAYLNEIDAIETVELRDDIQMRFSANLSKIFKFKKEWINSINFNLNFSYINNDSNSYWYNYKSSIFGGGIQVNF